MRKIFSNIHIWLSIPFGIIISIICLSGAILVFESEIKELCNPSFYFVEEVGEKPLSIDSLMKSAKLQLPDSIKANGIRIADNPERTYQIVLPGKKAAAFIDPYTGIIKGIDDGQGFFMQTMRLHRWLLDSYKRDGSLWLGKTLVGYSTLVFVIIIISGIITWIPRNKNSLKNRLTIKVRSGWKRFFYDLHVTGGIYAALLLLVISLTGLTWSFDWFRNGFYAIFGVNTTQNQPQDKGTPSTNQKGDHKGKENKEGGRKEGNPEVKSFNYLVWDDVLSSLKNEYGSFNSITIQNGSASVSTAQYGNTRGRDSYTFDPKSGKITQAKLYKDLPKSGKIKGWIYSVHVGSWGGMTTKILSFIVSVLGAAFAITGYYFWIKKKANKKRRKK